MHKKFNWEKIEKIYSKDNMPGRETIFHKKTKDGIVRMATNGYVLFIEQLEFVNNNGVDTIAPGYYGNEGGALLEYIGGVIDSLIIENEIDYYQNNYLLILPTKDQKLNLYTLGTAIKPFANIVESDLIVKENLFILKF